MSAKLDQVEEVDIESGGRFKYILVKLKDGNNEKYIVRGYRRAAYHADIYDEILPELKRLSLHSECVGGGRIEHSSESEKLFVYGYSMGFGQADHSITTGILKKFFPSYKSITFSNEGY
ncbi:14 kDa phosphohistidine phosphatase-like [Dendronephthya gigantea]|uniref:14 kDa phosphohistidine phosphatase-like n=1 Tax=Dendronephthya gigantea TaxID=151771 RepID=UPI00106A53B9|nr:14 kDa phosphohistidine phosphatase-like [Dendronephthya gigantea]XP_028417425.1 14 kDa phosphohistidine phosphatase-like [Dendronephthya gigantea]